MKKIETGFAPSGNKAVIELSGVKYLSTLEVARVLGLCASAFYAFRNKNGLVGRRIGRRKYYEEEYISKIITAIKRA